MWREFGKASFVVLAGYSVVLLMGYWTALFALPALQAVWAGFTSYRLVQLLRRRSYLAGAPEGERESFGFALGGLVSSCGLFLLVALAPMQRG